MGNNGQSIPAVGDAGEETWHSRDTRYPFLRLEVGVFANADHTRAPNDERDHARRPTSFLLPLSAQIPTKRLMNSRREPSQRRVVRRVVILHWWMSPSQGWFVFRAGWHALIIFALVNDRDARVSPRRCKESRQCLLPLPCPPKFPVRRASAGISTRRMHAAWSVSCFGYRCLHPARVVGPLPAWWVLALVSVAR